MEEAAVQLQAGLYKADAYAIWQESPDAPHVRIARVTVPVDKGDCDNKMLGRFDNLDVFGVSNCFNLIY